MSSDATRSERIVVGVDLRSDPLEGGLTVGASDLRRLDAREGGEVSYTPRTGYVLPLAYRWRSGDEFRTIGAFVHAPPRSSANVAFIHHLGVGALLDFAESITGLSIGYSGVTRILVPPHVDGAYLLDYRTFDFESSTLKSLNSILQNQRTEEGF